MQVVLRRLVARLARLTVPVYRQTTYALYNNVGLHGQMTQQVKKQGVHECEIPNAMPQTIINHPQLPGPRTAQTASVLVSRT